MKKIEISLARWCEDNGKNDLLLQWDAKKNEIHAEHVHYRSTKLFFWQCAKGHSWQAAPERRINHKTTECPVCTRKILSDEYNLEVVFPELSKQWDYEKNKKKPNEIFPNENKKYWWRCERNHSWYTSPNSRAGGSRCPYCMGALASPEYNLAVEFPHICEEWDHEKNSKGPETYLPRSEKKVHWRCKLNLNHRWVAAICYRTTGPSMCPECRKEMTTSFPEQAIFFYLCQLFSEVKNRYKHTKNCEVDIFIPSLNMAIEYDGLYFHKGEDRKKKDDSKTLLLKENSVHLLRIKEQSKDITSNDDENVIFCIVDQEYNYLENVVIDIVQNINCTYGKNYVIRPNIKRDTPKIMSQYLTIKKENSFAKKLPHLLDEWHYIKNQGLDPELLSYGSGYKVWWVCEKGHEWQSAISKRSARGGCPFCAGKKVCFDNCLNTINPKATKMWHKSKNGTLTPADVVAGSNKKVWWECKSGHEWEMSVSDANKGRGCPFCAGRRVSKNNALAIYNPAVAYEWNYDKNGELTPQNVSYSSNKKVWWHCEKGHEWEEKVSNRHHGKLGCPFCSNKRVTVNNNLKAVCADIAAQWHNYRNGLLSPEQVMPQSNKKVWWQCEKGHEWEAAVSTRFRGSGCPYCAGKKVDDTNSLAALRPHLVKFWHNVRNGDLTPNSVYYGYTKKVWWKCEKGHEWHRSVAENVSSRGCPYCSGHKVSKDTSLATLNPKLAHEWNYERNGKLNPHDVKVGSSRIVWWKCEKGHEWKRTIKTRQAGIGNCPFCAGKRLCHENALSTLHPDLASQWHPVKNGELKPSEVTFKTNKKVWWICSLGHEWSAAIYSRTVNGRGCPSCVKKSRSTRIIDNSF